ncbi:unnamed protein product [Amoebophrya sp. A25]|nr:unnamed protein product [Amoebophrya sp. A25]|eukprot:GSA25T00011930001.1
MKQELPSSLDPVPAVSSARSLMRDSSYNTNRFEALSSTVALLPDDGEDENKTNGETCSAMSCFSSTGPQRRPKKLQTRANKKKQMLSKRRLASISRSRSLSSSPSTTHLAVAAASSLGAPCNDDAPSSSSINPSAPSRSFCRFSCRGRQLPKKRVPPIRVLRLEGHYETQPKAAALAGPPGLVRQFLLLLIPVLVVVAYQRMESVMGTAMGGEEDEDQKEKKEMIEEAWTFFKTRLPAEEFLQLKIDEGSVGRWRNRLESKRDIGHNTPQEMAGSIISTCMNVDTAQEQSAEASLTLAELPEMRLVMEQMELSEVVEDWTMAEPKAILGVGAHGVVVETAEGKALKYVSYHGKKDGTEWKETAKELLREACTGLLVSNHPSKKIAAKTLKAYISSKVTRKGLQPSSPLTLHFLLLQEKHSKTLLQLSAPLAKSETPSGQPVASAGEVHSADSGAKTSRFFPPEAMWWAGVDGGAANASLSSLVAFLCGFIENVLLFHRSTGMAHQDLKSDNVFVEVEPAATSPSGTPRAAWLADFGETARGSMSEKERQTDSENAWGLPYCTVQLYADPLLCSCPQDKSSPKESAAEVHPPRRNDIKIDLKRSDAWTVGIDILEAMGAKIIPQVKVVDQIRRETQIATNGPGDDGQTTVAPEERLLHAQSVCVEVMNQVILPMLKELPKQFPPEDATRAKKLAKGLRLNSLNCDEKDKNFSMKHPTARERPRLSDKIHPLEDGEDRVFGERNLETLLSVFKGVEEDMTAGATELPQDGMHPLEAAALSVHDKPTEEMQRRFTTLMQNLVKPREPGKGTPTPKQLVLKRILEAILQPCWNENALTKWEHTILTGVGRAENTWGELFIAAVTAGTLSSVGINKLLADPIKAKADLLDLAREALGRVPFAEYEKKCFENISDSGAKDSFFARKDKAKEILTKLELESGSSFIASSMGDVGEGDPSFLDLEGGRDQTEDPATAFLAVTVLLPDHGDDIHHDAAATHDMNRDALHGGIHDTDHVFGQAGSTSRRVAPASDDDWLSTTDEVEMGVNALSSDELALVRGGARNEGGGS